MTADEFFRWGERLGLTQAQSAARLGISRRQVIRYEHGDAPIPKTVALACAAVEAGLRPEGA